MKHRNKTLHLIAVLTLAIASMPPPLLEAAPKSSPLAAAETAGASRPDRSAAWGSFEAGPIGETRAFGAGAVVIVRFESEPERATVEIENRPVCETPCSSALSPGTYDVVMKKKKWTTDKRSVVVEKGIAPVRWTLSPDSGGLPVRSRPVGLDVNIDGKAEGKRPTLNRETPSWNYEMPETEPRFHDQGKRVQIEGGNDRGEASLRPKPRIKESSPIAEIVRRHELEARSARDGLTVAVAMKEERVEEKVKVDAPSPPWTEEETIALGIEMMEIPAGRFMIGSPGSGEGPHEVVISRPFLAGIYEVTQRLWTDVMGENPSRFDGCGDDCPVELVSWFDAVEFCNSLSEREGLVPAYRIRGRDVIWDRSANGYRLPTEAEWEYACRAGMSTKYNTGDSVEDLVEAGWYWDNSEGTTRPVGGKSPNAWGLHDMHGNVWEWCWDRHGDYPRNMEIDPAGPSSGSFQVLRGGSWNTIARLCGSAYRSRRSPGHRRDRLGFRLFRSM